MVHTIEDVQQSHTSIEDSETKISNKHMHHTHVLGYAAQVISYWRLAFHINYIKED